MNRNVLILVIVAIAALLAAFALIRFGGSNEVDLGEPPPEVIEYMQGAGPGAQEAPK